ncbi:hypothetical protein B5X24_HaOG201698 [Helicoverpa armigera]|nr:hypothetical protein B5X24_HaOG201698 [Helicoverpa armigera]
MPERAREIAFQIRAQSPAAAAPPLTDSRAALRRGRARTSPALVTSRQHFDNFVTESMISSGDSAPDCEGEDAEDTFTGLKVLKHSYGELL